MSISGGKSEDRSRSQQFVDPNQVPFLQNLRTEAQFLGREQSRTIGGVAEQLQGRLGGIGDQLLGGLAEQSGMFGPGVEQAQGLLAGIASGEGQFGINQLLAPGQQLQGQLDFLDQNIQRNLASALFTLGGQATLQGQTGGDRQAFFSSQAAGDAQRAFAGGASNLLSADIAARRQLSGVAAGQQLGAAQSLGQLGLGQQQLGGQLATAGLNQLGGLFNLGLAPFQAEFQPFLNVADILGPPTVVGSAAARGNQSSFGIGFGNSGGN